jgi:hypothetical protein
MHRLYCRIEQFLYPAVGGIDTVCGDVLPDVVQIEVRVNAEDVASQARGFRR